MPLTIDPPALKRLQVTGTAGAVVLGGAAPPAGAMVTFASSSPALLPAPGPVTIAAGGSTGSFTVTDNPVSVATTVTLTVTGSTAPLGAPSLVAPAAGAKVNAGQSVTFSWSAVSGRRPTCCRWTTPRRSPHR